MSLPLSQARAAVVNEVAAAIGRAGPRPSEAVALEQAAGRVLAAPVHADRDQPPFDRSTRDGFAVRSADVAGAAAAPVALRLLGEVAAGASFGGQVVPGACVEIMTGAPLPAGADAVVMVEHSERPGPDAVLIRRPVRAGENFVPRGAELRAGAAAFPAGRPLDPAALALLASLGCARPRVFARPRVAVVATGDELVGLGEAPSPTQIRDSNRYSLAAQIARAGGEPVVMPTVGDDLGAITARLGEAVAAADLLLVSGGVSMGKYDHVEAALAALGARVVFDGVDIRPGRPLVFGFVGDGPGAKPFFGLPGNPLSTMVTFELFARPAVELLGGHGEAAPLRLLAARLAAAYAQRKLPLTALVPAALAAADGGEAACLQVRPLPSQGSGDLAAMAAADALMVIEPGTTELPAGAWVPVLPK
jgi:molybdopterin molybdotransferase